MKKLLLLSTLTFLLILGTQHYTYSQAVGISGTGAVPDPSALLDVDATGINPKGFLMPRLTTTQRNNIASTCSCTPAEGLEIFNITTKCFEAYVSGGWYTIACPTACTAPSAPTANAATNPCSTSFTANWTASTGATSYYLDVSTNSGFSSFVTGYNNLNVGNVTTYSVTGLSASTTYYYQLRAATTCTSVNSSYITIATNTTTAPSAPTAATHTPSSSQIVWNWNTSATATGYKWSTTNNYAGATDNAASTSYTQTSLTPLTSYTLYVWAYNGCGNSSATTLTSTTTATVVYVEDVFSSYTYTGNGSSQTITNGVDLSGQGGMVWIKQRDATAVSGGNPSEHMVFDAVRGVNKVISTNNTDYTSNSGTFTSFNNNGFSVTQSTTSGTPSAKPIEANMNAIPYTSWTFRNAANFYTEQSLSHTNGTPNNINLSTLGTVGMVIIKRTDNTSDWVIYHRSETSGKLLYLNNTTAETTDATLTLSGTTLTVASALATGTYMIYAWAHDVSANGIIQCGSFTPSGGSATINLGWEPQFVFFKPATSNPAGAHGVIVDNMRDFSLGGQKFLYANSASADVATSGWIAPTATGFNMLGSAQNVGYIYLAIRRGPMRTPTAGTQVYNAIADSHTQSARSINTVGFAPDMMLNLVRSNANYGQHIIDRLRGPYQNLYSEYTSAENTQNGTALTSFDMNGVSLGIDNAGTGVNAYSGYTSSKNFFKRAPGFFDEVCYTGTGGTTTIAHNLGVVPELIIFKQRSASQQWWVACNFTATDHLDLRLHLTDVGITRTYAGAYQLTAAPTSSLISLSAGGYANAAAGNYVAYLFATVPGVSKVGTYTGNGGTQTIGCGFSSTARFILIKRTDVAGDWFVWDTALGIVAGNDPHLALSLASAEVTSDDSVDPQASGFIVNQVGATNINVNAATYVFLAIN